VPAAASDVSYAETGMVSADGMPPSWAADRKVRLKPEHAHIYEGVAAGTWLPLKEVAEQLVMRARRLRLHGIHRRTFDPRHFDFHG